jgi:hypothetical protein
MSKGIPKRNGEVVDAICEASGMFKRLIPRSDRLHKSEAIAILTYIRTIQQILEGKNEDGKSN